MLVGFGWFQFGFFYFGPLIVCVGISRFFSLRCQFVLYMKDNILSCCSLTTDIYFHIRPFCFSCIGLVLLLFIYVNRRDLAIEYFFWWEVLGNGYPQWEYYLRFMKIKGSLLAMARIDHILRANEWFFFNLNRSSVMRHSFVPCAS